MLSSRGGQEKKDARGTVIYWRILHNDKKIEEKKLTHPCQGLDASDR